MQQGIHNVETPLPFPFPSLISWTATLSGSARQANDFVIASNARRQTLRRLPISSYHTAGP